MNWRGMRSTRPSDTPAPWLARRELEISGVFFDTHAHLDDEQLVGQVDAVVERAAQASVGTIVTVGTTAASSQTSVALARRLEPVVAAVGIQPNYVSAAAADDWSRIVELANDDHVVAIGETGLDAYRDYTPFDLQKELFRRHISLARDTGLPFIVHMRDCGQEMLELLQEAAATGPLRGVMHSFTGDLALANSCLDLGLHISFAGMVTFKKSTALRDVARAIPADRLLLETDAPYLSPHPHRGQRPNEPALLIHTARCVAEVRDVSLNDLAHRTTENAKGLFGDCGIGRRVDNAAGG